MEQQKTEIVFIRDFQSFRHYTQRFPSFPPNHFRFVADSSSLTGIDPFTAHQYHYTVHHSFFERKDHQQIITRATEIHGIPRSMFYGTDD